MESSSETETGGGVGGCRDITLPKPLHGLTAFIALYLPTRPTLMQIRPGDYLCSKRKLDAFIYFTSKSHPDIKLLQKSGAILHHHDTSEMRRQLWPLELGIIFNLTSPPFNWSVIFQAFWMSLSLFPGETWERQEEGLHQQISQEKPSPFHPEPAGQLFRAALACSYGVTRSLQTAANERFSCSRGP